MKHFKDDENVLAAGIGREIIDEDQRKTYRQLNSSHRPRLIVLHQNLRLTSHSRLLRENWSGLSRNEAIVSPNVTKGCDPPYAQRLKHTKSFYQVANDDHNQNR